MLHGIFDASPFLYDLACGLFTNTWNAGDIVRCIPHKTLHIDKLDRSYSIEIPNIGCVVVLHGGASGFRLWNSHKNIVCGKLKKIPVTRDYDYRISFCVCFSRKCSDDIVCFITSFFSNRYMH